MAKALRALDLPELDLTLVQDIDIAHLLGHNMSDNQRTFSMHSGDDSTTATASAGSGLPTYLASVASNSDGNVVPTIPASKQVDVERSQKVVITSSGDMGLGA